MASSAAGSAARRRSPRVPAWACDMGASRKFRLGSSKGARETRDEGRSDLGHSVTLLAALETRSALGVALYRLPRLSLSLSYTLSVLGEYVGR
jgi:hypothetical protein